MRKRLHKSASGFRFVLMAIFSLSILVFFANAVSAHHCNECATHTPTPTPSATATSTPTATPTATVSPTPTATATGNVVFPSCVNYLGIPGDKAHYTTGWHQIIGGTLMFGSDDVYRLGNGNYLQCFCPAEGFDGIQTNWLRTNDPILGWYFTNGLQWGLGNFMYAAQNLEFSCKPSQSPTPTPTPSSTPFDICPNIDGVQSSVPEGWYHLDPPGIGICRQFEYGGPESSHKDNPGIGGYGTGGQILGASTMAEAGTFAENLYLSITLLGFSVFLLSFVPFKKKLI